MGASSAPRQLTLVAAGVAAAGAIGLVGATVGDIVLGAAGQVTANSNPVAVAEQSFEQRISVVNQVQQIAAGDLSANTYHFLLATRA